MRADLVVQHLAHRKLKDKEEGVLVLVKVSWNDFCTFSLVFTQRPDVLTTGGGNPIGDKLNIMTAGSRGPLLVQDVVFTDEMAHFDRERIPERVVHAKGAGESDLCSSLLSRLKGFPKHLTTLNRRNLVVNRPNLFLVKPQISFLEEMKIVC